MKLNCKKMNQKTKRKRCRHWSFYRRLQMELGSNLSSQAHLSWPNHRRSTSWSIFSLVGSLEMERQLIQSSWTLWLECHPPRSWAIKYEMDVIRSKKETKRKSELNQCLHNPLGVPKNGIGVEICSGIEPEIELLLFVAFALAVNIRVKNVRVAT